jgi:hypothetical protein
MLLYPLENQFHLPALLVDLRYWRREQGKLLLRSSPTRPVELQRE